ncbi:HpcH/HpaI aldolase/citrate lyase family protein [Bordetella trematum]|uniref:HpcH/HpaI aldolase/citrate lyase family protein n=1 Tax=Bordetella trematum TaxID=123899 RepID=UPI0015C5579C
MMSSVVRSALFVPALRPDRIPKALATAADRVIVDLEDAVEPEAKQSARAALLDFLAARRDKHLWVRINGAGTPWHADDLAALRGQPNVSGIVLPKAESAEEVRQAAATGIAVIPIIETARGVLALSGIAAEPGVERLAFGSLDYSLDLDMTPDSEGADMVLQHARVQLLLQGRVAGLAQPLYGIFPGIQDTSGLRAAAIRARDMGYGGLLCIHPVQVPVVHEAFLPPLAELAWARQVVQAHQQTGQAAFKLDGKMIDAPVIARARRLLARAGQEQA